MSRHATTRIALGPLSFAPKRRPKRKRAQPVAVAPVNGGYPDVATWAIATALDPSTVSELAGQAKAHALTFDGLSDKAREAVAVSLLADALRRTCELRARVDTLPAITAHLVYAGLDAVAWDAIARKGMGS